MANWLNFLLAYMTIFARILLEGRMMIKKKDAFDSKRPGRLLKTIGLMKNLKWKKIREIKRKTMEQLKNIWKQQQQQQSEG